LLIILCVLRDGVIRRLFGLGSEEEIEGPETKLSEAACLMEMIDKESKADQ
jgi:hypothetical protein